MANDEQFSAAIDAEALDQEWLGQPALYHKWAVRVADARQKVAEAKADLDVTKAEVGQAIRSNPEEYGVSKPTVDAINEAVLLAEDYQKAAAAVIKAQHTADVLAAAVAALDHRKRALENLVELQGRDYFSTPRAAGSSMAKVARRSQQRQEVAE